MKTPLTLIRLHSETLLAGSDAPLEERRGYYEIIMRESERLSQLIQKVLGFSRIDRGEKAYTLEEGDLAGVVAQVAAKRSAAGRHNRCMRRRGLGDREFPAHARGPEIVPRRGVSDMLYSPG